MFLANMEGLYQVTTEQVITDIEESVYGSSKIRVEYGDWETITYPMVNGNCKVQWGQDYPYNLYCPVENGKNTKTGCVATAVAQLMSAYEYPSSYGGYTFDWSEMNKHINNTEKLKYEPAYDQIARLMQQLGLSQNLNMSYGLASSGAYSENIPRTLENFGFSNGGSLIDYSTNTIVSELKNGYYVLIGGYSYFTTTITEKRKFLGIAYVITYITSYSYSGGHMWLAHGLMQRVRTISTYTADTNQLISQREESLWYPLCNLGWGGLSDGYYLSGVFDAKSGPAENWDGLSTKTQGTENNYQFNVQMITEIRK